MQTLILVATALIAGLLMTRLFNKFNMPDVTAYLVAGVLIGPCCLGLLGLKGIGFTSFEQVESLGLISDVALGFIAFAIGHEFKLESLKNTGKQATIIGILQAVITTALVDVCLIVFHFIKPDWISLPAALVLGAIAAATAPAATLMVVRQYKAKGPVTDVLLPVVALDDAVGLVIFAISIGAAQAIESGDVHIAELFIEPLGEVILSLLFGAIIGFVLTFLEKYFHSNRNRIALISGLIVLTVALSQIKFSLFGFNFGFSTLLVCMMLGTIFCNTCPLSDDLMDRADKWSAPILLLFFVLSGADLQLGLFKNINVIIIGVTFILVRSLGKYFGARFSSVIAKSPETVKKWLGITLLPQAGVALGMCATAAKVMKNDGTTIRNIILFAVLVYELVGPSLTKMALTKAGDIKEKSDEVRDRRKNAIEQRQKQNV